jgi:hypothetical protein
LKLTIDIISMPLKNMGLKDGPFKPILNFNFIAWMDVWWQRKFIFIVIQIQSHLKFQNWAYKPLGRMKMLPIFVMQHLTSIKTQNKIPSKHPWFDSIRVWFSQLCCKSWWNYILGLCFGFIRFKGQYILVLLNFIINMF